MDWRTVFNPLVRREWIYIRRHWIPWLLFFGAALTAEWIFMFAVPWVTGAMMGVRFVGLLQAAFVVFQIFTLTTFLAAWLTVIGLEREGNRGNWEQLAVSPLSPRAILIGKLSIPIFFLLALHLGSLPIIIPLSVFSFQKLGALSGSQLSMYLLANVPSAALEHAFRILLLCAVSFRVAFRYPLGAGLLRAIGSLVLINLGLGILESILRGFSVYLFGLYGGTWDSPMFYLLMEGIPNLILALICGFLFLWFFRRCEALLRSALAECTSGDYAHFR